MLHHISWYWYWSRLFLQCEIKGNSICVAVVASTNFTAVAAVVPAADDVASDAVNV